MEKGGMEKELSLPELVAQYRTLRAKIKDLEAETDAIRSTIQPLVKALPEQKWGDEDGYARMKHRAESFSYPSKAVDDLAQSWANSKDPIMQSCGEMLLKKRSPKPSTTYLEVR